MIRFLLLGAILLLIGCGASIDVDNLDAGEDACACSYDRIRNVFVDSCLPLEMRSNCMGDAAP